MSSCHSLPPPSAAPCLVYTSCPPSQLWPLSATAFSAIIGSFSSCTAAPQARHCFYPARPVGALLSDWHSNVHSFNCTPFNPQSGPIIQVSCWAASSASGSTDKRRNCEKCQRFNKGTTCCSDLASAEFAQRIYLNLANISFSNIDQTEQHVSLLD